MQNSVSSHPSKRQRVMRKLFGLGFFIVVVHLLMASSCGPTTTNPVPDYSISVSDVTVVKLASGAANGSTVVTISRTGGFTGAVALSVTGAPAGVTLGFSAPSTSDPTSTLNLTVADTTAAGAYDLTVTGTAGTANKTDAFKLTVNPAPAPTVITVAGRVLDLSGNNGLSGVNVRIVDANGNKDLVVTDGSGNFTVSDVKTPYSVSAVVPASALLPQTWSGVTRSDPKLVMFDSALASLCTRTDATISGNINPAVGATNTADIYFIGEGISIQRLFSSATVNRPANSTNYTFNVPFDSIMCQTTISGKLVYLEKDSGGSYVKSAVHDVTVTTGNPSTKDINPVTATTSTLSGTVSFPTGLASASVYSIMKFGDAYAVLPGNAPVTPASPDYNRVIPSLAGIEYHTLTYDAASSRWAYSNVLAPGGTANLTLPNLSTTVSPSGLTTTTTPTFTQTPVTGTNLYLSYVSGGGVQWIGGSQSTSIALPDLPNPARLAAATAYTWSSLNAIQVRNASSVDDMLDGRFAKHLYFSVFALYNPGQIATGSVNATTTNFNTP